MKLIEFTPPKGMAIPEGKGSGDTFDSIATFRIKPDGKMCLVAIGDHKLPGYDKDAMTDGGREMGDKAASRYREKMDGGGY